MTPFALFCGLGLVVTYALLGCTWLVMKTAGDLQARMYHLATPLLAILLLVLAAVSVWTPIAHPEIAARWFTLLTCSGCCRCRCWCCSAPGAFTAG
ncbi:Cytochrome oxidase subunit II [Serratia marcescens]|uniref:Cytochrome oxidase subunit II n=1 Tax=Serratia marcescens TaxID=615 RepID=A0A379ZAL5_SERMA|nr:Cytochrome oxidase subunit II [Serratia marcescens]